MDDKRGVSTIGRLMSNGRDGTPCRPGCSNPDPGALGQRALPFHSGHSSNS